MSLNFPLDMSFKIIALGSQMAVTDAGGNVVFFVKQKILKLKEAVTVFADQEQAHPLYTISADRVIDISARYSFADTAGNPLGAVKRRGLRSMWRAQYDIFQGNEEQAALSINEESVAVRVADGCLNSIPVVSLFAGYFFHPAYLVSRPDGTVVMKLQKQPAFFEGKFKVERLTELDEFEEIRILLSLMMMTLLERARG